MSLPHALLTALIECPSSGLELAKRFDRSIGYFWPATHQQIYRELAKLEVEKLVEAKIVEGARGGKKNYRVLPKGRSELKKWVAASQPLLLIRDELLVRLRAAAVIDAPALPKELKKLAGRHKEKLALYQEIETRDFSGSKMTKEQKLHHLVLKAGIEFEQLRLDFCKQALALLKTNKK